MSLPDNQEVLLVLLFTAHVLLDVRVWPNERAQRACAGDVGRSVPGQHNQSPALRAAAMGAIALLGFLSWRGLSAAVVIALWYLALLWSRRRWRTYTCWHYLGEHAASFALLILTVVAFTGTDSGSVLLIARGLPLQTLALAAGLVFTWSAGSIAVGLFVRDLRPAPDAESAQSGTPEAGALIGRLERTLILLFVLANVPSAIGFLVAAKSLLRFGEVTQAGNREQAEYVIIGTLASFTFAVPVAYATAELVRWAA